MALTNQRIWVFEDSTAVGETIARLAAGLGAQVTLVKQFDSTQSAPEHSGELPYEIVVLDNFGDPDGWLETGVQAIDHLLIGLFEEPAPLGAGTKETNHPWLSGSYHRAYTFAQLGKPRIRRSVALFSGPGLVPTGQKVVSSSGLVEDNYVRWLVGALKPLRVNAVWTPPVQSPLQADATLQERQAFYLSATPPLRSRFAIREDVAKSLIYLMDTPALNGSVLRVDQTLIQDW